MKALIITNKGCEDAAKKELSLVFGIKKSDSDDYVVRFEAKDYEKLIEICYKTQSAAKVLVLLDEFSFKTANEIKNGIEKLDLEQFFGKETQFACRGAVFNNEGIDKKDFEPMLGEAVLNSLKKKRKVNLENPDLQFYAFVNGKKCYFGIDFAGLDLSMREYKVFTGREDLKGNVAFAMLMLADYKKEDKIIDPFMRSGIIPIEAALFALKSPVNYYQKDKFLFKKFPLLQKFDFESFFEKIDGQRLQENVGVYGCDPIFRNVQASQKNGKIAGILKRITLTRQDTEWLDIKLKEGGADKMITYLPVQSKIVRKELTEKAYNEFFYQADYVLKKKCQIIAASNAEDLLKNSASKHKFKIVDKKILWQGQMALDVFVLERDSKEAKAKKSEKK